MRILEYGTEQEKALLFLPCTAEPEWAFTDSVTLLAQGFHVLQVVYGRSRRNRRGFRLRGENGGPGDGMAPSARYSSAGCRLRVLPGWGLPDPVPGPGGDSRGPCRHRCGHHALSPAVAPPVAHKLGGFSGGSVGHAEPEAAGSGLSPGALDPAGPGPEGGIRCSGGLPEDLFGPDHSECVLVGQ